MPVADSFIDTNILLYAISTEPAEAAKTAVARQLLTTENWGWSARVAAEFVNASTAKRRPAPLTHGQTGASPHPPRSIPVDFTYQDIAKMIDHSLRYWFPR